MKVSEVIEKAISKEIRWLDAARILGISDRQMRRWKLRYEAQDTVNRALTCCTRRPRDTERESGGRLLAPYAVVHCIVHGWPQARLRDLLPNRMLVAHPELFVGDPDAFPTTPGAPALPA